MAPKKPTRKEQYEEFQEAFYACLDRVGIAGMWEIRMEMMKKQSSDVQSTVTPDYPSKIVKVEFSHVDEGDTAERIAKHEVSHLIIGDLAALAQMRFVRQEEVDAAEERVCIILQRVL